MRARNLQPPITRDAECEHCLTVFRYTARNRRWVCDDCRDQTPTHQRYRAALRSDTPSPKSPVVPDHGAAIGHLCVLDTAPCAHTECRHWLPRGATCSIREANAHPSGMMLVQVGDLLGCTRERVRQIEAHALRKLERSTNPVANALRDAMRDR